MSTCFQLPQFSANKSITILAHCECLHPKPTYRPGNEPSVLGARLGSGPPNRDRTQFLCSAETETETEQEHSPRDRTETEQPPPRAETEHLPLNLGSARFGLNCSGNLDI